MKEQLNEEQAIEKFLLRINKDTKSKAEGEAKKSNRSLNGHIVTLVEQDLKLKGLL
jgi:predicted HicB family RNase H-like nuclease